MASQLPPERPITSTPPTTERGMTGRIKRILTEPKAEWPRIAAEPDTAMAVFKRWAVPLAAIPPVAGLIGGQLMGYRPPIGSAIATALLGYGAALLGVWVLTLIIEALAPTFRATKSRDEAMKLAAYSWTAAWVAGVLAIIPPLAIIGAIAGLYSLYLLWLGLPVLMRAPEDQKVGYYVAVLVAALVVNFVIGAIVASVVIGGAASTIY